MSNIFVHQIKKGRKTKKETLERLTSSLKRDMVVLNSYIDANDFRGIISSLSTIENTSKNIKEVYLTIEPKTEA